jgi:predicted HicB family RNase H-like nuclease
MTNTRKTNKEFAATDQNFLKHCKATKVEPTKRQASKFRMGKGKAFKLGKGE